MARLVWPAALLLLLACTDTGIIHENIHIWANSPLSSRNTLHINCFLHRPNENVLQVNWERRSTKMNKTIIAVFNPSLGTNIIAKYKGNLQVHFKSSHNVSITLTGTSALENGTSYCCKFVTYPSGNLEECLKVDLTKQKHALSRCAVADRWYGCSSLRTEHLATLLVVAGLLIGILILLGCIHKMKHRKSVQFVQDRGQSAEGTQLSLEVEHPAKRALPDTPFSAFFVMTNLDFFTDLFKVRVGHSHTGHRTISSQPTEFVSMENTLYSE